MGKMGRVTSSWTGSLFTFKLDGKDVNLREKPSEMDILVSFEVVFKIKFRPFLCQNWKVSATKIHLPLRSRLGQDTRIKRATLNSW